MRAFDHGCRTFGVVVARERILRNKCSAMGDRFGFFISTWSDLDPRPQAITQFDGDNFSTWAFLRYVLSVSLLSTRPTDSITGRHHYRVDRRRRTGCPSVRPSVAVLPAFQLCYGCRGSGMVLKWRHRKCNGGAGQVLADGALAEGSASIEHEGRSW